MANPEPYHALESPPPALRYDLESVFEHAPIGLAVYDVTPDLRCVRHNPRFLDLVGQTWRERGSIRGVPLRDLFDEQSYAATRAVFEGVLSSGQPFTAEEYEAVLAPDPQPRYYKWSLTPLLDAAGAVTALLVSAVEVSERRRAADRERAAREQAEQAVSLRDEFLSVAAHELKTPLTALLGQAQLLQRRAHREGHLAERDRRSVDVIAEQAARLNRMVLALLDVSRLDHGQLTLERAPLDLAALVRRVVAEITPIYDGRALLCQTPDEPVLIVGDALRLEQVIVNLIGNAVKYSAPETVVRLAVERRGDRALIQVADEGIGIQPEALPHLFDRYYRGEHVNARQVAGMGVGLYVVREVVALHGGAVSVTSDLGRGSTFTVSLPAQDL